jgi:hypothetical protein
MKKKAQSAGKQCLNLSIIPSSFNALSHHCQGKAKPKAPQQSEKLRPENPKFRL